MSSDDDQTKTRILKATLKLLEESQGKGVRMADIAKQSGISRQAVYLHFSTRAELLTATTHYLDKIKETNKRLISSRTAKTGAERLSTYIEAWGNYIPEIYGIAKALLAMSETDEAAKQTWDKRMQDMREGCEAAIMALKKEKKLSPAYTPKQATDILWTMLSIRNWELLRQQCRWSQEDYIRTQQQTAHRLFVIE